MPTDVGIIDLMLGIPDGPKKDWYAFLKPLQRDHESLEDFEFPVEYMFKEVPDDPDEDDNVAYVITQMDRFGIAQAMIGHAHKGETARALREHPDRFLSSASVDPNRGMAAVRDLERPSSEGAVSAQVFPAGCNPQVPINDKRMYPIYAKCVELDIPIFVCVGVPGPRRADGVPAHGAGRRGVLVLPRAEVRDPSRLRAVDRPGGQADAEVAEPLLLDDAFAPRYYPKAISTTPTRAAPTR